METLFWASVLFIAYVYVGYPVLLAVWSRAAGRAPRPAATTGFRHPTLSVVVAARNEAPRLVPRIENLLELTYPHPIEIIVVSDGSTDGTRDAVLTFGDRVRFLEVPRGGKPRALNAGVAASHGEVVVFADARQRFATDALLALAANFADPDVGAVTGELMLDCEVEDVPESTVADGVGLYWKYEKWMRRHESLIWSTLGATGAIYAMRRELWRALPPDTLLDDVLAPMRVVLGGKRVVFDERARAFDRVADAASESRRKTRTLAGNYQILALEPRLLIPIVNPVWLQYVSHKLGRLVVPWALVISLISSAVLAPRHWPYALALLVQLCFYGLAIFGGLMESRNRRSAERAVELGTPSEQPAQRLPERGLPLSGG
jgi:cellulose synthase/poly-beta-1,6-N-acetylglucosamine synthase-like glycosyltransferase